MVKKNPFKIGEEEELEKEVDQENSVAVDSLADLTQWVFLDRTQ